jgi:serine/threonine-protein phosphatase 2A regulatory subunit A
MDLGVNPLDILKEEMESDDLAIRVNAVHRAQLVAFAMTPEAVRSQLIPYLDSLVKKEDD